MQSLKNSTNNFLAKYNLKRVVLFTTLFLGLFLYANDYTKWLEMQNKQYNTYKKSLDDEFVSMLKKDWEAFKMLSSPSPYKKPKPIELPKIKKEIVVPKKEVLDSPKIKTKPIIVTKKLKKPKPKPEFIKVSNKFNLAKFDFYGEKIIIRYDKKSNFFLSTPNKKTISSYWDKLSQTNYKQLIKQINIQNDRLNLNDWAKYQFVRKLGLAIYQQDENLSNLFIWFILSKMNYDTKVGYNDNSVYLLSCIGHKVYQTAFLRINGKKYYILTKDGRLKLSRQIYTYVANYPKANKKLSFKAETPINLHTNLQQRKLSFNFQNKHYEVIAKYNKELVNFYKSFPQSDYGIYFNSKKSNALSKSLLKQLQLLIDGKSEIEAVNFLLRFTQTAFKYKTDPQQFNHEKVLFPEETIYYPYSDCEDRSIMFAYLVKNLLHLDIVGIKYKNHLATAVNFTTNISGDSMFFNQKKYTISDPTYINANAGMTMPSYKNSSFDIINIF
jgi:hypothetical protein